MGAAGVIAPLPDFRYVGLGPLPARQVGVGAAAFALGASVTLATSSLDSRYALIAGSLASVLAALGLQGARLRGEPTPLFERGSARMGIVPWGVLVHTFDNSAADR